MSPLPQSIEPLAFSDALLSLLQLSGALVALKTADSGRYLWANPAYAAFLGVEPERLRGATDLELLPLADATAVRAADQRAVGAAGAAAGEHRFERCGSKLDFRTVRLPLQGPDGAMQVLALWWDDTQVRHDAAQLQHALQQIEQQQVAFEKLHRQQAQGLDRPTELFRNEQFEEHLRREVALSHREHREFALALMALDGFEALCQARGADAAHQVLETIGQLLRTNTRAMDVITRLSDDRYAVLLSGVGLATAHTRMEQLRRQCATHLVVHVGQSLGFEVSVGVASFPHTADTLDAISLAAERALTDAMRRGGNRVALASIALGARARTE
ncbi:MAG: GGDEF domain-containing protein [Leptothrix sp. (in: b-proteobacteria)]